MIIIKASDKVHTSIGIGITGLISYFLYKKYQEESPYQKLFSIIGATAMISWFYCRIKQIKQEDWLKYHFKNMCHTYNYYNENKMDSLLNQNKTKFVKFIDLMTRLNILQEQEGLIERYNNLINGNEKRQIEKLLLKTMKTINKENLKEKQELLKKEIKNLNEQIDIIEEYMKFQIIKQSKTDIISNMLNQNNQN